LDNSDAYVFIIWTFKFTRLAPLSKELQKCEMLVPKKITDQP